MSMMALRRRAGCWVNCEEDAQWLIFRRSLIIKATKCQFISTRLGHGMLRVTITIGFDGTIRDPSSEERAKAFEIQSMRISAEKREKEIFLNKQPEEKGFLKKLKNLFHKT